MFIIINSLGSENNKKIYVILQGSVSLLAPRTSLQADQLAAVRRNAALKEQQALDLAVAMQKEELQIKLATSRFFRGSPARKVSPYASPNKGSPQSGKNGSPFGKNSSSFGKNSSAFSKFSSASPTKSP